MKKLALPTILFVFAILIGCQSDADKLNSVCNRLSEASKMTDDCDKMANALEPIYADYKKILDKLSQSIPDEASRFQITNANSLCTRTNLEISTGVCGKHPKIEAMTNFE